MIATRLIEIRDKGTFIPALAVFVQNEGSDEDYLLRRAGWAENSGVYLLSLHGGKPCQFDPYEWGDRTYHIVHVELERQIRLRGFHGIPQGAVFDVEFLLGEKDHPKISERETAPV